MEALELQVRLEQEGLVELQVQVEALELQVLQELPDHLELQVRVEQLVQLV
jgi:hypothetical protein